MFGSEHFCTLHVSQKDPGFDRGQFYKQAAVMRGQVRFSVFEKQTEADCCCDLNT